MKNQHRALDLLRLGPEPRDAPVTVVAVHGRGQTPQYMVEFLVERVDDPTVSWLLPAAADGSWYPNGFMVPFEENQPMLDDALDAMAGIERRLAGVPPENVVWAGFSQGACVACEHVARNPGRRGGLLVLTGGRIGPHGTDLDVGGDLLGMPAYFGVGDSDAWVPIERVHETADVFRAAGASVTVDVFEGRDHEISDAEIDRSSAIIAAAAR